MGFQPTLDTVQGPLSAAMEHGDHFRGEDAGRMISAMFGDGRDVRLRAFREIEKAALAA